MSLTVYLIVAAVAFVVVTVAGYRINMATGKWDDRAEGLFVYSAALGFLLGMVWPITVLLVIAARIARATTPKRPTP